MKEWVISIFINYSILKKANCYYDNVNQSSALKIACLYINISLVNQFIQRSPCISQSCYSIHPTPQTINHFSVINHIKKHVLSALQLHLHSLDCDFSFSSLGFYFGCDFDSFCTCGNLSRRNTEF